MASSIHDTLNHFDFVDSSLSESVAKIGSNRIHYRVNVLFQTVNECDQFRNLQSNGFIHPWQERIRVFLFYQRFKLTHNIQDAFCQRTYGKDSGKVFPGDTFDLLNRFI